MVNAVNLAYGIGGIDHTLEQQSGERFAKGFEDTVFSKKEFQ